MDKVNIPTEQVPEGLKECEQILKRAKEVRKVEPVVTYWCCFAAAQKALDARSRTKEETAFLMILLDTLEEMKVILKDNDAVTSDAAGAAYIENFALKVFMSADNDDRNGVSGKGTIRKFVVASQFIEILRCFENGMTEEMEQKLQYARWKSADGAKALREGRVPTSGPPIPDIEPLLPELPSGSPSNPSETLTSSTPTQTTPSTRPTHMSNSNSTPLVSPRPSPAAQNRANLPGLDISLSSTPNRDNSRASGAWSTVATPGLADGDEISESQFRLPSVPTTVGGDGQTSPRGQGGGGGGEKKNVRFTGPDGAPLSPAQTHCSVDSYDTPGAPPPTILGENLSPRKPSPPILRKEDTPSSSSSKSTGSTPITSTSSGSNPTRLGDHTSGRRRGDSNSTRSPHSSSSTTRIPPGGNGSGSNRTSPAIQPTSMPLPPAPPPSLVSTYPSAPPPITAHPNGLGLTSPPASAPLLSSFPPAAQDKPIPKLTRKQVEQTQKHAKWAVSALEFDDPETARLELRKALAILGG